ncbi:putative nonribosomal peptide synthetase [Paxillus ammoniavirescens]|nr:putative nonribosomal peptide synthetase [Paxillus ammoniavirescens]
MASASSTPELPPLDCSLLFPDLINFHMQKNPAFPMFLYADKTVPGASTEISFLEFGRAAHRVAHTLRPSRQGPDGQVVMVIANTDTILHHAVVAGISIAGLVPFPVSSRNSPAAIVNMMKKINCFWIVTLAHAHQGLINAICRESDGTQLTLDELPTLAYTFPKLGKEVAADPFDPYPPPAKRPELQSPAIYVHSSGSTGFPKPIAHSYQFQIHWLTQPGIRGYANVASPRRVGAMALPPFHAFGLVTQLYAPFSCLSTTVVYPPRTAKDPHAQPVIPTSDNILECVRETKCHYLMIVPTFLEQMVTEEEAIEVLKNVEFVCFGGGPLAVKVGDALCAAGVPLCSSYGGTEFGTPVAAANKQDIADGDWSWMRFGDDINVRWVSQGDDTYECQILSTENNRVAVENLPDVRGYATADIFLKHPTKDMWKIIGRVDDVIMLASGEKTVPAPIETIINSSPLLKGSVMFGRERNQAGILVEPHPEHAIDVNDEKAVMKIRNEIWPVIEEANKTSPAFSRIFKEMILVTSSDKPMLRTAKGTVQRKGTLQAYEAEINALYDTVEASSLSPNGLAGPSAWTSEVLEEWLLEHASVISHGHHLDSKTDLFAQGFDSLSVTYLRNQLVGALRKSPDPEIQKAVSRIPPNVVFENPTIQLLSSRVAALVNVNTTEQAVDPREQHKRAINAMIEKYSIGLHGPADGILNDSGIAGKFIEPAVVLLTGSTGGLGSFLLAQLLESPMVERVYALNRPSSVATIGQREKSAFLDRGLPADLLDSKKLVYIVADASQEKCGLPSSLYEEVRDSITVIIHDAWRLNFNLAISSFEDSIRATRNLVDLGLQSPQRRNIRFLFTSSVGSAQAWDNNNGPYPEEIQLDPSDAIGAGYGESKYATERVLAQSGLHATSLHIGQIAGGPNGSWATTDWFPIIECVARAILDVAFAKEAPPPALNLVNPRGAPWADVIHFIRNCIIKEKGLTSDAFPIVPFADWFALLEKSAEGASKDELAKIPGIKLLEFFRAMALGDQVTRQRWPGVTEAGGMTNFSTTKSQRVSPTMAHMQPIGEAEAESWVRYWISKGAL